MANGRLDYHRTCQMIFDQSRVEPVIVFADKGDINFYFESSNVAKMTLRMNSKSLVGIYDKRATLKMICEDIL